ncbi:hypothetical protein DL762_002740 [Monosporascus cannonballus]|uniref:GH16 domain-containing protein n=1 Tax=Monosporascus cannonballus TaxID=155416 RepID=A0ABY0HCS6_9PEZI|nr:hypothetical protein DL763_010241 [Monosporascus cannonballus]RYO90410.1 hypothetical protein DL762_002740 [Monosporascus cannonballus]
MNMMRLVTPLLTLLFASSAFSQDASPQVVNDDQCQCYFTNGTNAQYFTKHKFFDFRSLSEYAGVPGIIQDAWDSSHAHATSDYFLSDEWTDNWTTQSWNNSELLDSGSNDASYLLVNSPNNIYIEANRAEDAASDTYLTMRTSRLQRFQTAAEFESVATGLHYVSVRMFARTRGAPGAVTAMFTYRGAEELADVQESDLEIRTMDPLETVQYTNQPSYTVDGGEIPEATRNVTLPRGLQWTDWAVYRMDWTPTTTTHYIDGEQVAAIEFQNPRDPSQIYFNCWGDGGSWSGVMRRGHEAFLQIQWIDMVYNETTKNTARSDGDALEQFDVLAGRDAGTCHRVCSIDQTGSVGTTVLIDDGTSGGASSIFGVDGHLHHLMLWIPFIVAVTIGAGLV